MAARTLVVVNPKSRGGSTRRRFEPVERRLREVLGELEVEWTRGPRDAVRIAREGVRAGVERIVVAGGDGTIGEVVDGVLAAGHGADCQIGLLPFGTGGDLSRTLGPPRDLGAAVAALAEETSRSVDAGRVHFEGPDRHGEVVHFANAASAGISGLTTFLVNRAPKQLGGRASFFLGTVRSLLRYSFPPMRIAVDGKLLHEGPLTLAAACNGRFFGGGMQVAPDAVPDDGLLDLILVPAYSRARLLTRLPRIYRGTHLREAGVVHTRGRSIELDPLSDEPVWIELDGEPLGRLPVRVEILPAAMNFFGVGR
ncbi:MAG: diacylglycerol kinase family protein [Myxococcota bacterium]